MGGRRRLRGKCHAVQPKEGGVDRLDQTLPKGEKGTMGKKVENRKTKTAGRVLRTLSQQHQLRRDRLTRLFKNPAGWSEILVVN